MAELIRITDSDYVTIIIDIRSHLFTTRNVRQVGRALKRKCMCLHC